MNSFQSSFDTVRKVLSGLIQSEGDREEDSSNIDIRIFEDFLPPDKTPWPRDLMRESDLFNPVSLNNIPGSASPLSALQTYEDLSAISRPQRSRNNSQNPHSSDYDQPENNHDIYHGVRATPIDSRQRHGSLPPIDRSQQSRAPNTNQGLRSLDYTQPENNHGIYSDVGVTPLDSRQVNPQPTNHKSSASAFSAVRRPSLDQQILSEELKSEIIESIMISQYLGITQFHSNQKCYCTYTRVNTEADVEKVKEYLRDKVGLQDITMLHNFSNVYYLSYNGEIELPILEFSAEDIAYDLDNSGIFNNKDGSRTSSYELYVQILDAIKTKTISTRDSYKNILWNSISCIVRIGHISFYDLKVIETYCPRKGYVMLISRLQMVEEGYIITFAIRPMI
jgi:hypothetical protein